MVLTLNTHLKYGVQSTEYSIVFLPTDNLPCIYHKGDLKIQKLVAIREERYKSNKYISFLTNFHLNDTEELLID
jgi:hypothetical protein